MAQCRTNKRDLHREITDVLRRHPEVVRCERLGNRRGSALHEFLAASDCDCDCEAQTEREPIIDDRESHHDSDTPCNTCKDTNEIVQLLLQINPSAASHINDEGLLPIHFLMNRPILHNPATFSTIQTLLRAYPESVVQHPRRQGWKGLSPLEVCFAKDFPRQVREEMMSYLVPSVAASAANTPGSHQEPKLLLASFYLAQDTGSPFTMELAQGVRHLLLAQPKLIKFDCHIRHWEEASFYHLMESLASHSSLEEIGCLSVPIQLIAANPRPALECIQRFVQMQNCAGHLRALRWAVPYGTTGMRSEDVDDPSEDSALLQAIYAGLIVENNRDLVSLANRDSHHLPVPGASTPSLENMELENFLLMDSELLHKILMSPRMPRKLQFTDTVLGSRSIMAASNPIDSFASAVCRIQDLRMTRCPVATECILPLLHVIAQMSSLQKLDLGLCNYRPGNEGPSLDTINLTPAIVAILEHLPHLKELNIRGARVRVDDMEPISQVLRTNTTLQIYDVPSSLDTEGKSEHLIQALKHHNTALQIVTVGIDVSKFRQRRARRDDSTGTTPIEMATKIAYWTLLNRQGRQTICKEDATKSQLVRFLLQATFDPTTEETMTTSLGGRIPKVRDEIVNIHYGLLREIPNLWCCAV